MKRKRKLKKPFYKKLKFWLSILAFLSFVFLVYFFLFSSFFEIKEIEISELEEEKIEKAKEILVSSTKENFLKKNHIFFANLSKAKESLLSFFPEISEVKFSKKFPDKISVLISKRIPLFAFCQTNCYLLDKEGIIFEPTTEKSFLKIEKEEKEDIFLGKKVLEKENIEKILKIKNFFEESKVEIEKVIFKKESVEFLTKEKFLVLFDFEKDIDFQLKKFKALWEKLEKKEGIEYIDLRFGNRAFLKYR